MFVTGFPTGPHFLLEVWQTCALICWKHESDGWGLESPSGGDIFSPKKLWDKHIFLSALRKRYCILTDWNLSKIISIFQILKCISMDFYPRPVLAFGYCRCLRLSVCPSVRVCGNHLLVRAITQHLFKLGSPNLHHRCKRPWLRSLLFLGVIDLDLQGQI